MAKSEKRLAILSSHPIQYHSAWFRKLAAESGLNLEVFYCHQATATEQAGAGFGVEFNWDMSLLDGYPHRFVKNVAATPTIKGFSGLDTPEIKNIIARERFDAVMINGWHYKSAWQAMRACWKTSTPVMVRSDSHLHTERTLFKRFAKWPFYSWFISKLDACLPVGKWSSDYFLHYGAAPDRVFIVPHAVDIDYFKGEARRLRSERTLLRAKWGLDEAATVFVFAGKFIDKKRPLDFVNAVQQANAKLGQASVAGLMVGDGPLRESCEEVVQRNGIPVKFAGFLNQSQISQAYVAADALVLPSDGGETWGLVVNEGMACGLPCFVSDRVGCGPDMIILNETGGVFPLGDTEALANLMTQFAADRERIRRMSERATEQATRYSVDVAVDRTLQAVEAVSR
ncbi:MAG TPA: glycosyltransferase family 4 protein [Pyrinomonadaceae bacterium]